MTRQTKYSETGRVRLFRVLMKQLGKVLFTASQFAQCLAFYETLLCIKKQGQEKGIGVN